MDNFAVERNICKVEMKIQNLMREKESMKAE